MSNKKTKKRKKKSLTPEEIDIIKNSVKSVILPKGSLLYRTQSEKYDCNLQSSECEDTGKFGTYFANSPHIAIGMVLEYKEPLNLCIYKTTKDLTMYLGKYAFRSLEPKIFFKSFKNWESGKNHSGNPKNKNYWNHFDKEAYPIIDLFHGENFQFWNKTDMGEIFITDDEDYELVKLDRLVTMEDAEEFLTNELNKLKIEQKAGGTMFNYIINPETGRKVTVSGKLGKKILKLYLHQLNI